MMYAAAEPGARRCLRIEQCGFSVATPRTIPFMHHGQLIDFVQQPSYQHELRASAIRLGAADDI